MGKFFLAVALTVPVAATALPADGRVTMTAGSEKFFRAPIEATDVVVEPAGVITAELMPSKEILVTAPADAKGWTSLVVVGSDLIYTWEICIAKCPAETTIESAKPACPDLAQVTEEGKKIWTATVKTEKCLNALLAGLVHANLTDRSLELTLQDDAAAAFYRSVEKKIADDPLTHGVTAGYYGATLELTGEAPRSAVAHAIAHAYLGTAGAVSFDDRTTEPTEKPK